MGMKLVSHINGSTYTENFTHWGSDEDIWAEERGITGNGIEWHIEDHLGLHCTTNTIWVTRSENEMAGHEHT